MAVTPSKTLAPNGALVDLQTGRATPPFNNYLNNLTQNTNAAVAGSVATPAGGGLSGGGLVADGISLIIAPNGVSDTMLRQSAAYSVIGRPFGTDGDVQDITATADNRVLARIGGVLAFTDTSLIPATVADGNYGDITVSGSGAAWTINSNVVSNAKFRQSAALSVVGRSGNTTGDVADISGSASQFMGVNAAGTGLAFQTMAGDATLTGATLALAIVNANTGMWGSATQAPVITLDAKGRATAASNVTITPAASSITGGAALSRTNDTNVTLALGGSPTTALLAATSMTLGWTGQLAASRGGTGVATLGDITRTDDTNVTLTLGGTPTGAVITSTSFTLGWTGTLGVARGGIGVGTVTGLLQGNGTSAVTAITDSSSTGQVLRVTGASTYAWGALSLSTAAAITGTLPVGNGGTGITSFGTGVATWLGTPSSANLAAAITDETGSGALVFANTPTLVTPVLGAATGTSFIANVSTASFASSSNARMFWNSSFGLVIGGVGSLLDMLVVNGAGSTIFQVVTGTQNADFAGTLSCSTSTTASAANVFQSGSTSVFLRSTSSLRYKDNVADLAAENADLVLGLRPITYTSKAQADDPKRLHWGFIAEEADKTLPMLVNYDDDGLPDGFQYERVIVGLLSVVRRMEARITELEKCA